MQIFVLTEDQAMLRDLARDLVQGEVRPRSEAVDHEPSSPKAGIDALREGGLVGCMVPEEYGGAGLDAWSQTVVLEETAKECGSTAWALANLVEVAEGILRHGTPEQKRELLPMLLEGGMAAVAGSDAVPGAPFRTNVRAEKTGEGYQLSGRKENVPLAGACELYLVAAQEGDTLRWFLLRGDQPGLRAEAGTPRLGMKGCSVGALELDGCQVSTEMELTGDVLSTLDSAQALDMAAIASGISQGALKEAITYVNQRVQFGKTIAQFENTQQVMAELLAKAEAARALVWEAARVKDAGGEYRYAADLAKVMAADTASLVTRKCVQFMGGYGYSREYPVERKMRDAKMTELYGGASEERKAEIAELAVVEK